jgi:amino acid adenylation domain-containing protein
MQRKLLVQHRMFPDDAAFNLAAAYRLGGEIDVPRLMDALRRLLGECTALNTTFADGADGPVAIVSSGGEPGLRTIAGYATASAETDAVGDWISERADKPIPPESDPPYDVTVHVGAHATYLTVLCSHLVADAYTFYNLIAGLERLYADPGAFEHLTDALHADPARFARAVTDDGGRALDAFRELLGGVRALGHEALVCDREPGGALPGTHERFALPAELAASLRGGPLVARDRGFAVFLSAYAVVLAGLTGRRHVVVGVPVANRRDRFERQAFGYFVNTLPLAIDLSDFRTFDELSAAVSSKVFVLLRHQGFDVSEHADELLATPRSGPIGVDNFFTYYKERLTPRLGTCEAEPIEVPRRLVKYPFGMNVEDDGERYVVALEYVPRLAACEPRACVQHVLETIAHDPSVPLSRLAIVDAEGARRIGQLVNESHEYPVPRSLDAWFRATARTFGHRPAVADPHGELSYAELDASADRVASVLRARVSGDTVAISMGRRNDLIAVILGALRAGKTYVPIDPAAPPERARHIVAQFPDLTVVGDADSLAGVDGVNRLTVEEVLAGCPKPDGARSRECAEAADAEADLRDHPAYVIFTSGSTGVPKGVEVTHRNVMRLFRAGEQHFDFGARDTWCLFHSYAFDFSVWEIFGALLYGGRLVIVPDLVARSPEAFAELLVRERVTVLNQTPSAFRQLNKVLAPHVRHLAVRWVVFGGEALHFEILRPWLRMVGDRARLVNMYGITETTVHVTFYEVSSCAVDEERESVIGRPLGDLSVHVVDHNLNPSPLGVPGEVLVGGAGVARGYRNRPDLTAERFLTGTAYGGVVYRTGDRAYVRPDGTLVFLGRIDKQVQLRGYRIELGEIEAALLAVAGVRECAVRLDESVGEPRLVAYLVGDGAPADGAVRAELARRIPAYMIPAVFMRLPRLPLNVNGKVDDARLPAPAVAPPAVSTHSDDELAVAIARIWAETIQGGAVGTGDNFFEVGGTSLHVAEVHRRVTTELDARNLAMVELFEFPTPASLAVRIRGTAARSRPRAQRRPVVSRPGRGPNRRHGEFIHA